MKSPSMSAVMRKKRKTTSISMVETAKTGVNYSKKVAGNKENASYALYQPKFCNTTPKNMSALGFFASQTPRS